MFENVGFYLVWVGTHLFFMASEEDDFLGCALASFGIALFLYHLFKWGQL